MSPAGKTLVVTVSRRFAAPPGRVFDAWLDPATAGQWLFATPEGVTERVEIDARIGGRFVIAERRGNVLAAHFGRFVEIDRPRRLVFTFTTGRDEEPGRVDVGIRPEQGDGCELTLSHEMDARWARYEERTREGWAGILAALERTLK